MTYKRKTNLEVRPLLMEVPIEVQQVMKAAPFQQFIETLEAPIAAVVKEQSISFIEARGHVALSMLEMGRRLIHLRSILEPLKKWKEYINLWPNFTQATAYRYIWAWENAQRLLPPAMLKVAAVDGYKIIDPRKGKTFAGKYAIAFKRVTKKLGPPPAEDEEKAREFLREVVVEKKKLTLVPARTVEWSRERMEGLQIKILTTVAAVLKQVPEDAKKEFIVNMFETMQSLVTGPSLNEKNPAVRKVDNKKAKVDNTKAVAA
jgi:hypothetical protein